MATGHTDPILTILVRTMSFNESIPTVFVKQSPNDNRLPYCLTAILGVLVSLVIFAVSVGFMVHNFNALTEAGNEVQETQQALEQSDRDLADAYADCISYPEVVDECDRTANTHTLEVYEKYYGNGL